MRTEAPMKKDMLRVEGASPIMSFRVFMDFKIV